MINAAERGAGEGKDANVHCWNVGGRSTGAADSIILPSSAVKR